MRHILVATDLSSRSDAAIVRAYRLAQRHDAALTLFHAVDEDMPAALIARHRQEAESAMRATAEASTTGTPPPVAFEIVAGRCDEAIIECADRVGTDLIVIGKHRRDALFDLFRGSTGERIVRFGTIPVLIVKQPPRGDYAHALAAVDFSEPSRRAVEFGMRLAPEAVLHLVHAFDIPFRGLMLGTRAVGGMARQHQKLFRDMVEREAAAFLKGLPRQVPADQLLTREGPPAQAVLSVIEEINPDLLVLGTHGRSGIGRALLGSVAEALIAAAPCDVLAVRGW